MRTLAFLSPRSQTLQALLIITVSVVVALMFGTGRLNHIVMLGGAILFVLLVWDLRLVIPLQLVLVPFGPKYEMWFGNLYVATPVMIIACVAWVVRNSLKPAPFSFRGSPIIPATAVFLIVLVLSALQNLSALAYEIPSLLRFIQFFFYSALFAMVFQMELSRKFIKAMLVLAILVGLMQGLIGARQWITNPGYYVTGTFGGKHSSFAVYVVFICMLMLGILFETRRALVAAGVTAGLGILVYSFIFSFSRTGYVSIAAGLITFLCLPVSRRRKTGLLVTGAAIMLLSYSLIPEDIRARAGSIVSNLSGRGIGISVRERLTMWQEVIRDVRSYPILGRGAWTYAIKDNFFLKVLGESGIVGLAAFICLLSAILHQEWKAMRMKFDDSFVRGITLGLIPATIGCLIVFSLSVDLIAIHRFMATFWIVLALTQRYRVGGSPGVSDA
jgi:O-antigen ligase